MVRWRPLGGNRRGMRRPFSLPRIGHQSAFVLSSGSHSPLPIAAGGALPPLGGTLCGQRGKRIGACAAKGAERRPSVSRGAREEGRRVVEPLGNGGGTR